MDTYFLRSISLSILSVIVAFMVSSVGYATMGVALSLEEDSQGGVLLVGALVVGLAIIGLIAGIILSYGHYRTGVALQRQQAARASSG